MKDFLIVIDMQNDFLTGPLGSEQARACIPCVVQEITSGAYTQVVATMDTHGSDYLQTQEGKLLPVVHCIRGTPGWQIAAPVQQALTQAKAILYQKPCFGCVDLARDLASVQPSSITLCGVCTDICVISNALLCKAWCPEVPVTVLKEATAATTPEKQEQTLAVLQSCQVLIR